MLVIFDLDGTLIDSSRDLAISVNEMRRHFELEPLPQQTVNSYVGEGAAVLVRRAMPRETAEERLAEGLEYFIRYYRAHALENTRLYAGVREAVEALDTAEHQLAVLTNKPEKISFDILAALGMAKHFFRVYGGGSLPGKKPDPVGIRKLMEEAAAEAAATLMVGDSRVDIETARNAGVRSCGVLWGLQPESFSSVAPDFTIADPNELLQVVTEAVRSLA